MNEELESKLSRVLPNVNETWAGWSYPPFNEIMENSKRFTGTRHQYYIGNHPEYSGFRISNDQKVKFRCVFCGDKIKGCGGNTLAGKRIKFRSHVETECRPKPILDQYGDLRKEYRSYFLGRFNALYTENGNRGAADTSQETRSNANVNTARGVSPEAFMSMTSNKTGITLFFHFIVTLIQLLH